jgi:hypothetical protein
MPEIKNTKLFVFKVPRKKSLKCIPNDSCSKMATTIIFSDCTPLDPNTIIIKINRKPKKPLITVDEVNEDAKRQSEILNPAKKIIPKYEPSNGPQSKLATRAVVSGNKKAIKIIEHSMNHTAKNLPTTMSIEEIGEVKSKSIVRSFFSSEISRIAINGIRIKKVI